MVMQSKSWWRGGALGVGVLGLTVLLPGARFAPTSTPTMTGRFISVTGSALVTLPSATTVSQINLTLNVNTAPSAVKAETELSHETATVTTAVEKLGVPVVQISVTNQSLNLNGGKGSKVTGNLTASETVLVNAPLAQADAVFSAIESALAPYADHGNYYLSANPGPATSILNAPTSGLDQAIAAATKEATTVAKTMGVTLGPIQSVTQESFNGNGQQNANQVGTTVQVVFATIG